MSTGLTNKLNKLGRKVAERGHELKALESELLPVEQKTPQKKSNNGLASDKIVEQAENRLLKNEQLGLFSSINVALKKSAPTLLTRIPVFMAIPKAKQKDFLNEDNALEFETPFGKGKRYGANLGVFEEDVIYAMARLSKKRLTGTHENLPITVPSIYKADDNGNVHVNSVLCTVTDILKELEMSNGGRERARIIKAIENLCSTSIVLTLTKRDRYLGDCEIGKPIKLIDVEWNVYSSEGYIYGQFSPVFTYWIEEECTYLDWEIRKKLKTSLAKALHRYLSGQISQKNKDFCKLNKLEDIAASIGYYCRKRSLKSNFESAAKELVDAGYLADSDIIGTGRAAPFKLLATKA